MQVSKDKILFEIPEKLPEKENLECSPSFDKLPSGLSLRVEDRTVSKVEPLGELVGVEFPGHRGGAGRDEQASDPIDSSIGTGSILRQAQDGELIQTQ